MRTPSLWQILIVVLIIVLLFGAKRLPDMASSIGQSLKIFKKEVSELRDDDSAQPADHDRSGYGSQGPQPPHATGAVPPTTSAPPGADTGARPLDDPGSTTPSSPGGTSTDGR